MRCQHLGGPSPAEGFALPESPGWFDNPQEPRAALPGAVVRDGRPASICLKDRVDRRPRPHNRFLSLPQAAHLTWLLRKLLIISWLKDNEGAPSWAVRGEKLPSLGAGPDPKSFQPLCMGAQLCVLLSGAIGGVREILEFIVLCPWSSTLFWFVLVLLHKRSFYPCTAFRLLCNFCLHILGKRKRYRHVIPILNVCGTKGGAFALLQSCLWATPRLQDASFIFTSSRRKNPFLLKIRHP